MDTNASERSKHFLKHLQSSLKGDQVTQKSTSCILNIIIFCMGMALWVSRDHFKTSNIQHCSVKEAKCSRLKPSRPRCEMQKSWIILLPHNTVLLGAPVPAQILPETTHHVPLKLSLYDCVRLKFTFKVLKKKKNGIPNLIISTLQQEPPAPFLYSLLTAKLMHCLLIKLYQAFTSKLMYTAKPIGKALQHLSLWG